MQCPICNAPLMVSKRTEDKQKKEVDLQLVCVNPRCDNYAGRNLNDPLKIAKTVRNKTE